MVLSISEKITHSSVRIEILNEIGQILSTGSGFFFRFSIKGENNVPVLVTNKHVIKDAKIGRLVFTICDEDNNPKYGEIFTYNVENFESGFFKHLSQDVDLCIMPLLPLLEDAHTKRGKNLFLIFIDEPLIPTEEQLNQLSVMEDIIMFGYPNGLWDQVNNLPIIRRGVTAIHPKFEYNGKSDIVIDMACFPGSSGSPIFIYNQGSYSTGDSIAIGSRLMLLGILYAGPQMTVIGNIETRTIPTSEAQFSITNHMINSGYAIKSRKILDFKHILEHYVH